MTITAAATGSGVGINDASAGTAQIGAWGQLPLYYLHDRQRLAGMELGYSTSPGWPAVSNEVSTQGNGGMVDALKADPYAIAYVGIS